MFRNGLPHEFMWRNVVLHTNDTGAGGGGNPPPADNQGGQGENGTPPTGLTEEQWALAFEHPRFKELTKRAKEAETALTKFKTDSDAAEQEKLKEQQKFKELWEQAEAAKAAALAETERVKAERIADAKRAAVQAAATLAGFHPKAAATAPSLIDLAALPVSETGAIDARAVEQAVKTLGEEHPYMLGNGQRQDPGSPGQRKNATTPARSEPAARPLTL